MKFINKYTECSFTNIENIEEILAAILPLGFNTRSRIMIHSVS